MLDTEKIPFVLHSRFFLSSGPPCRWRQKHGRRYNKLRTQYNPEREKTQKQTNRKPSYFASKKENSLPDSFSFWMKTLSWGPPTVREANCIPSFSHLQVSQFAVWQKTVFGPLSPESGSTLREKNYCCSFLDHRTEPTGTNRLHPLEKKTKHLLSLLKNGIQFSRLNGFKPRPPLGHVTWSAGVGKRVGGFQINWRWKQQLNVVLFTQWRHLQVNHQNHHQHHKQHQWPSS